MNKNTEHYIEQMLRELTFRPERSRPIWRNKHTGTEVAVTDLSVDDHGGFQGGCRRFVVHTDQSGPPGYPDGRRHPLDSWLRHWEPTGRHIPVEEMN